MVAAPGTRSVVGDDGGGVCDTGDLDSATLEMTTSAMRHRGPGQCDPGDDDVEAAQETVKQCSPGDDLEEAQGGVKQYSPGDDLEAAQGTVKQCSPGDDLEVAQGTVKQCSPGDHQKGTETVQPLRWRWWSSICLKSGHAGLFIGRVELRGSTCVVTQLRRGAFQWR
ncbi:hypothetical protein Zmor_014858 [Zophobas morio]|uniref:Uncharacterized protein n=1 Tax=Zophobas morio TaxID=2755281 RepID=A0AA38IFJ0_9CUCU|nr:hypothetical protein Zmor_014858 [Zophobas morio]